MVWDSEQLHDESCTYEHYPNPCKQQVVEPKIVQYKRFKWSRNYCNFLQILTTDKILQMIKETDSTVLVDKEIEEMFIEMTTEFVESSINGACLLAKHRKGNTLEVKDVLLYLEKNFYISVPGFHDDKLCAYRKTMITDAHKQRLALIKRTLKK